MDLHELLEHLSISDIPKVSAELSNNGLGKAKDLEHLDAADKTELIESLKAAGVSLGDRGKLKRLQPSHFEAYRAAHSGPPSKQKQVNVSLPPTYDASKFDAVEKQVHKLTQDKTKADALWKDLDANGNGIVSLAELDRWVKIYFPLLNDAKAMIRAHAKTTKVDGDGDAWIQRNEFEILLVNLFYFCKLGLIFDRLDNDGDHRLDFDEFVAGVDVLGFGITREKAWNEFCKMDDNRGGKVLFDEFCIYVAAKQWPGGFHDYYERNESIGESARRKHPDKKIYGRVTGTTGVDTHADIHTTKYDKLEQELLSQVSSKSKAKTLFQNIDRDGSGKISKKEFKIWAKNHHPSIAESDAITFAFLKTNEADGDKYVQPDEFQDFFYNLFYFVKLKFVFSKIDKNHDSKVSFEEFKKSLIWIGLTMDTEAARNEFDAIDNDGGGNGELDFSELCSWVASKKIPVD